MSIHSTLNPGIYHGFNRKPPFFEGWYYKLVSADQRHKVAVIPGVILGQDEHAFVQVLDSAQDTSGYLKFPAADFRASDQRFAIEIGENRFDDRHLHLALNQPHWQLTHGAGGTSRVGQWRDCGGLNRAPVCAGRRTGG